MTTKLIDPTKDMSVLKVKVKVKVEVKVEVKVDGTSELEKIQLPAEKQSSHKVYDMAPKEKDAYPMQSYYPMRHYW